MTHLTAGVLQLEPQVAAHAAEMFEVLSDPAIYEFENAPPPSREWLEARFKRLEAGGPADGTERWFNWVIRLPNGALAGYVQATVRTPGVALIAYELSSAFWRQGIGFAAVQRMLEALHCDHDVDTFVAVLKTANHRSLGLLTKLGFEPARPQERADHGAEPDETVMIQRLVRSANAAGTSL